MVLKIFYFNFFRNFRIILELWNRFNNIWKKHTDKHADFKTVFENIKIEIDTLEYILQAAKG